MSRDEAHAAVIAFLDQFIERGAAPDVIPLHRDPPPFRKLPAPHRKQSGDPSGRTVVRRVVVTGFVVALALAGCFGGGEQATSEPERTATSDASTVAPVSPPTPTERVLQAIRKCDVKTIFFTASELTFVTYRDGTKARSKMLDQKALSNAAQPYVLREDNCRIILAIE